MKKLVIINLLAFCKSALDGAIGIAMEGLFASSCWIISDEAYRGISGRKFGWYGSDGNEYVEDKSIMVRPTEQEVLAGMSSAIKAIALKRGYIKEVDVDYSIDAGLNAADENFPLQHDERIAWDKMSNTKKNLEL